MLHCTALSGMELQVTLDDSHHLRTKVNLDNEPDYLDAIHDRKPKEPGSGYLSIGFNQFYISLPFPTPPPDSVLSLLSTNPPKSRLGDSRVSLPSLSLTPSTHFRAVSISMQKMTDMPLNLLDPA